MTRDDDLAERVDELQRSLEELRREVRPQPPRGPGGLPRPPTPSELVRFADRQAIPTAIAVLEANIHALELLQAALRLTDPGRAASEEADRTRERAADISQRSLDRLDAVLDDLQEATRSDTLPPEGDARDILEEARGLREDIADRIGEAEHDRGRRGERTREIDTTHEPSEGVTIDVEDELDSIRAELEGEETSDEENGSDNEDGNDEEGENGEH